MYNLDTKNLSEVLEVEDISRAPITIHVPKEAALTAETAVEEDKQLEADMAYARSNLYEFIEAGKEAMNSALELAQQSEHARSYEVFFTGLKAVSDINAELMKAHELKRKMKAKDEPAGVTNNTQVNNPVFVGSTTDLAKMLKGDI